MATEYKKTNLTDVKTRTTTALTSEEQTRVDAVITRFFELFSTVHS